MSDNQTRPRSTAGGVALWTARAGAISYIIWSFLHLLAAWSVYKLGHTLAPSMVQGRLFQDAFNLAAFSVFGFGVAITLNWRNHSWGYWINFGVIGVADVGFIICVLVPGHMPLRAGLVGPLFWGTGLVLTTVARFAAMNSKGTRLSTP